ncbi:MAG: dihydroneopterin aldolase [Candidatus Amulumruptor caecigallinarius]|nr:dihydroneopterin aldolase [Candidatus Amulumruptor caecigallinarius]
MESEKYFIIKLESLRFNARIGVDAQERVVGNEFSIDISLELDASGFTMENIRTTVSYADVYEEVRNFMSEKWLLLESVVTALADRLKERWPQIRGGSIALTKLRPPVSGMTGSATVELRF